MNFKKFANLENIIRYINSKNQFIYIIFSISYLYTLYSLFSYYFQFGIKNKFAYFRIPKMGLTFPDLRQITHSSECGRSIELLRTQYNCDPYGRPYNYPRLILDIFKKFNLDIDQTNLIGLIFGLILIISITFFIFKLINNNTLRFLISSLFLMSFPVQLLIERGNYDSIILVMMIFIPLLIKYKERKNNIVNIIFGLIISYLCISLKIFPAAGLIAWRLFILFKRKTKLNFFKETIFIFIFCLTTYFTFNLNNINLILKNTLKPIGYVSFGFLNLYQTENTSLNIKFFLIIKVFLILYITSQTFIALLNKNNKNNFMADNNSKLIDKDNLNFFILFSLQIISVYFLFDSWDYRLIFILGIIPFLANYWFIIPKKIGFLKKKFIPYIFLTVGFQQYLRGNPYIITSYLSDLILQPILIGFLIGYLLFLFKTINLKLLKE